VLTGQALSRETYYDVLYRTTTWSRVRYLAIPLVAGLRIVVQLFSYVLPCGMWMYILSYICTFVSTAIPEKLFPCLLSEVPVRC
jgi:hypothetical protein